MCALGEGYDEGISLEEQVRKERCDFSIRCHVSFAVKFNGGNYPWSSEGIKPMKLHCIMNLSEVIEAL
jgi:hypothetical protein